jgi:hypothetical protein
MVINYEIMSLFMGFPVFISFLLKVAGVFFLLKSVFGNQVQIKKLQKTTTTTMTEYTHNSVE